MGPAWAPDATFCAHRYLAHYPGYAPHSSSLKRKLLCGSVVLSGVYDGEEWYYPLLEAGKHYVKVENAWSDVAERLAELRAEPLRARRIAAKGRDFAMKYLTREATDCYLQRLLRAAAQVVPEVMELSPQAIPLEEFLVEHFSVGGEF